MTTFQLANRTLWCLPPLQRESDLLVTDFPIRFLNRKTLTFSVHPQHISTMSALTVALLYCIPNSKLPMSLARYSPLMISHASDTTHLMTSSGVSVHGRIIGRRTYGCSLYIDPPALGIGYFVPFTSPPRSYTSLIASGIKSLGNTT